MTTSTLIAWGVAALLLVVGSLVGTYLLRKREKKPPAWHASRVDYGAIPASGGRRREAQDSRSMSRTVWPDVESVLPSIEEFETRARQRRRDVDIDLPVTQQPIPVTLAPRTVSGSPAVATSARPAGAGPAPGPAPSLDAVGVVALQPVSEAQWTVSDVVALSSLQLATVAAVLAPRAERLAATAEPRALLLRFGRGAALRIARADTTYMNTLAAANAVAAEAPPLAWLDAKGATAIASTLLAVLAVERHLDPIRAQIHELRAGLAGLAARSDSRAADFMKTAAQELARFVREAVDNPAWAIATPVLRGRAGDAAARALQVWRELQVEVDAVRQKLETLAATPYFSDVQLTEATPLLRELVALRAEIDVLACILAGLQRLRLALGDGPSPGTLDPLQSVAAGLQAGNDRDSVVVQRLAAHEAKVRNEYRLGTVEFEDQRSDLRAVLEALTIDRPSTGQERVATAAQAVSVGFPEASGADERWLFRFDKGNRAVEVRRLSRVSK